MDLRGLRVDSFQCRNHPEREGVGICVACRRVFCIECSTKIDGVNHCRECLGKRQRTAQASVTRRSSFVVRSFEVLFSTSTIAASLVLVGLLVALVGEASAHGGKKRVANRERMETIVRALRTYKRDVTPAAFPGDDDGLDALVRRPPGIAGWNGPYIPASFVDSHGAVVDGFDLPVKYRGPRPGDSSCVVGSGGADRRFETDLEKATRLKVSFGSEGAGEGDDLILFVD